MSVSQPVVASPSQSPKPVLHAVTAHAPAEHDDVALRSEHARRHTPQLLLSLRVLISQPFDDISSQSANPSAQRSTQRPITHAPVEFSPAGHRLPHAPQFIESLLRSVSHPLAALMSQFS